MNLPQAFNFNILWSKTDFIIATQRQINKDLCIYDVQFEEDFLEKPLPYEQLTILLSENLKTASQSNRFNLQQMLYTVDLPEKEMQLISKEDDFFEQLAEIIINREALKVFLRSQF